MLDQAAAADTVDDTMVLATDDCGMTSANDAAQSAREEIQAEDQAAQLSTGLALRRRRRAKTTRTYLTYQKEFKAFCDVRYESIGDLIERYRVDENKLHNWLKYDFLLRESKLKRKSSAPGVSNLLSAAAAKAAKSAVVDLWQQQVLFEGSSEPHPAGRNDAVAKLLSTKSVAESQRKKAQCVDRGIGHADGLSIKDYIICNMNLLQKASASDPKGFRDRMAFNLHWSLTIRGDVARATNLSDFGLIELAHEGHQKLHCMIIGTQAGNRNDNAAKHTMGAIRHKDWHICLFNTFAAYMFMRFHINNEAPPDFASKEEWYNIKLLLTRQTNTVKKRESAITYATHKESIASVLQSCGHRGHAVTHRGRETDVQNAEKHGLTEIDMRRAGGWSSVSMEQSHVIQLPVSFIKSQAGFSYDAKAMYLGRAQLVPPEELARQIFPWLDGFGKGEGQVDFASECTASFSFHKLMCYFRIVLLQDMVLAFEEYPNHPFRSMAPFDSEAFTGWADQVKAKVQADVDQRADSVQQLAPAVAEGLQATTQRTSETYALMEEGAVQTQKHHAEAQANHAETTSQLQARTAMFKPLKPMQRRAESDAIVLARMRESIRQVFDSLGTRSPKLTTAVLAALSALELRAPSSSAPIGLGVHDPRAEDNGTDAPATAQSTSKAGHSTQQRTPSAAQADLVNFKMRRDLVHITDAWQEWHYGLAGQPSVCFVEQQLGAKWRPVKGGHKKYFFTRRRLICAIAEMAKKQGIHGDEAAKQAELLRGGLSMVEYGKILRASLDIQNASQVQLSAPLEFQVATA